MHPAIALVTWMATRIGKRRAFFVSTGVSMVGYALKWFCYSPEYPLLLLPLEQGVADVVYGSRFVSGRPHRVLYFWHAVGNRMLTLLSNMFTDLNLTDMETCFKMFRRDLIQSIELCEDRFGFEPEITAKIAARKVRVYEVGISYTGRTYEDGKKIGWRDGVRAVICIVKYSPLFARFA